MMVIYLYVSRVMFFLDLQAGLFKQTPPEAYLEPS